MLGQSIAFEFPVVKLLGFSPHREKRFVFPGMIPSTPQKQDKMFLLGNLSDLDWKLLD
jgi:hypothetical protein